jgi:hypothetical protein
MRLILAPQRVYHVTERGERLVDVLRFLEAVARGIGLSREGGRKGGVSVECEAYSCCPGH